MEDGAERRGQSSELYGRRWFAKVVDLDQNLTRHQQVLDSGPVPDDEVLEKAVAAIAAGDPDDPRRRTVTLLKLNEVAVFGEHHSLELASPLEDVEILCREETKILDVYGLALAKLLEPPGESRRELSIDPNGEGGAGAYHLGSQCRMIEATCRIPQTGGDVLQLQIGIGLEDLILALASGQKIEHVAHPDPHPSNAGTATALVGVDRDPVEQDVHEGPPAGERTISSTSPTA
jgi:hypothetical protein